MGFSFSSGICGVLVLVAVEGAIAVGSRAECSEERQREAFRRTFFDHAEIRGARPLRSAVCPRPHLPSGPGKEPEKSAGEIRSVSRNVRTTDGGSKSFDFKYGFHDRGKKKTIVLIKGGPNARSWIDNTAKDEFKDYNLIVVELPGAGRNRFDDSVDFGREVHVEAAAKLVKDIVSREKLDSYLIAGHSYGTTVATAAASMISNDSGRIRKPQGVLLVGTVGRATRQTPKGHEVTEGAMSASDRAFASLDPGEKEKFKKLVEHARSGPEGDRAVSNLVGKFLGPLSADFQSGVGYIRKFLNMTPEQAISCLNAPPPPPAGGRPDEAEMAYQQKFYAFAGCELVSRENAMDTSHFFDGLVTSARPNACHCSTSPTAGKYDSRNWPVRNVPLYYVSGEDDFNTPPSQTHHHQLHQGQAASKTLFQAPGGHGLGYGEFVAGGCGAAVEAIFRSGPSRFQSEMSGCTSRPAVAPVPAPAPTKSVR